jgi:hypothetical protein
MTFSIRRLVQSSLLAFIALANSLSVPAIAVGAEIEGLHGEAATSIQTK